MSYEPTNWKNGDIVTADKLNKLERGVASAGGGALIVTEDAETGALNKTWKEIHDAAPLVWVEEDGGYFALGAVLEVSDNYIATFVQPQPDMNNILLFITDSADGYPVRQGD